MTRPDIFVITYHIKCNVGKSKKGEENCLCPFRSNVRSHTVCLILSEVTKAFFLNKKG